MKTKKEDYKNCVRRRFKRYDGYYVRTVNVNFVEFEDMLSNHYMANGYSFLQIEKAVELFFGQIKEFVNKNISNPFHEKASIKCLDFWIYYVPTDHQTATVSIQIDPLKDFLKPVRHYAGLSYPEYGDDMEATLKVCDDGFGNAARYDVAIKLHDENEMLKRRVAWLEKQIVSQ